MTVKAVKDSGYVSCNSSPFLWYAKKEKYLQEISMFSQKKLSHAYLIWVPELDLPKNGIPLSKWT